MQESSCRKTLRNKTGRTFFPQKRLLLAERPFFVSLRLFFISGNEIFFIPDKRDKYLLTVYFPLKDKKIFCKVSKSKRMRNFTPDPELILGVEGIERKTCCPDTPLCSKEE